VRLGSSVSVSGPCVGGVISAAESSQLGAELSVLVVSYLTDSSSLVGDMRVSGSLSVRSDGRLGSTVSVSNFSVAGRGLSVKSTFQVGGVSFGFGFVKAGSGLSTRNCVKIGRSLSADLDSSVGSCLSVFQAFGLMSVESG
jgi:hypothetical protein